MRGVPLVFSLCLLVACAGEPHRPPVEDRGAGQAATGSKSGAGRPVAVMPASGIPRSYSVVSGDTLYAIAWRYGFDYRKLAGANNIAAPYRIYPGQSLVLSDRSTAGKVATPVKKTAARVATSKPAKPAPASSTPTAARLASGPGRWRWPTSGKVVRGFSGTLHKGVDIDGRAGDKVMAVAPGTVVYAGNGIVGYGNLLIVKHSDVYLSAYGHNRRLLVEEGEVVNQGQKIAEKGSSATNSVKLHFEIRREGKPVDPTRLLSKR